MNITIKQLEYKIRDLREEWFKLDERLAVSGLSFNNYHDYDEAFKSIEKRKNSIIHEIAELTMKIENLKG